MRRREASSDGAMAVEVCAANRPRSAEPEPYVQEERPQGQVPRGRSRSRATTTSRGAPLTLAGRADLEPASFLDTAGGPLVVPWQTGEGADHSTAMGVRAILMRVARRRSPPMALPKRQPERLQGADGKASDGAPRTPHANGRPARSWTSSAYVPSTSP